jgi:hypothetical protein
MDVSKGGAMSVLWMLVIAALVLLVLAFVVSLGHHEDPIRDPRSHERRWESPHLESRGECELTHDTGSPHLESRSEYERTHATA